MNQPPQTKLYSETALIKSVFKPELIREFFKIPKNGVDVAHKQTQLLI